MELCSLLVRNVSYEIPSLKKQIAKCQQLQQEYSRKEEEGQAGAAELREQFHHSCKQYGITVSAPSTPTHPPRGLPPPTLSDNMSPHLSPSSSALLQGDNVRRELLALVNDLPGQLAEIGTAAQSLGEAIDLYQACVGFVCER